MTYDNIITDKNPGLHFFYEKPIFGKPTGRDQVDPPAFLGLTKINIGYPLVYLQKAASCLPRL